MLRDLYGVNYYMPPKKHSSDLELYWFKKVWEDNSIEDWKYLGNKYNATHLLAPKNWDINLILKAENTSFKLYEI